MSHESAVQFATESRIHMGLVVRDLEKSLSFYQVLFGQAPTKTRPHYAKFEVAEPPVNLALNELGGPTGPNNPVSHFGIQVKSTAAVHVVAERVKQAGFAIDVEDKVTCCYAVQNKFWATDPDGNKWEVYVVLDNDGPTHESSESECCPELPRVMEALQRGDLTGAVTAFENAGGMNACGCLQKTAT